jgi:hypothetical protein
LGEDSRISGKIINIFNVLNRRDLGWFEGNNMSIEYQFGDGQLIRLGELAESARPPQGG